MAVFLVNQCTFSKLPNVNNDEQNVNNTGLPSSNICGLKFDSLFELIHHIEDNHINDVEYSGIAGPFYNGPQRQMQPIYSQGYDTTGNISTQQPMMNSIYPSGPYNIVPHDRNHMTQIINGGWLPTSCVLRIFNTTQKKQPPNNHQIMHTLQLPQHHLQQIKYEPGIEPHIQQQMVQMQPPQGMVAVQQPMSMATMTVQQPMAIQQQMPVQQTMPVQQQIPIQQQLTVDMMSPNPQLCTTPIDNSHHIILTSPKIVGTSLNGTSFHVASGAMTTMAPQQPPLQQQSQTQPQPQQQSQPMQPPPQQQQQLQPISQQSQMQQQQLQAQPQQQQMQVQTQPNPSLTNAQPAPVKTVKTYKCADCNKTYKTLHGMRSHHSQVHPNSPHIEPKAMIVMSESGDTPTGSPAPLTQNPIQVINSPQPTASSVSNSNSIQQQQLQQPNQTLSSTPKPTKVYKCADCNKTYKTQHGMRTHQNQVHPNSPHVDVKTMAIMPESGDTPTGSPADLPQQQGKIAQQ